MVNYAVCYVPGDQRGQTMTDPSDSLLTVGVGAGLILFGLFCNKVRDLRSSYIFIGTTLCVVGLTVLGFILHGTR